MIAEVGDLYRGVLDSWNNRSAEIESTMRQIFADHPAAAFHGRPEMSAALTEELRALL